MATTMIEAGEAPDRLNEIVGRVHDAGETVIVERSGEPLAAVVPVEVYERYVAERAARFAVLDRLRAAIPQYPEDEVLADVEEAVRAARRERADRNP